MDILPSPKIFGLNFGKIRGIPGFRRTGWKFIQDSSLDRASFETLPALLTKVKHDCRLSFVETDDTRRASADTGAAAVAPESIDPGV